jgi:hypothetical protein
VAGLDDRGALPTLAAGELVGRLTTAHAAADDAQPVLVRPDGSALGPGEIRRR